MSKKYIPKETLQDWLDIAEDIAFAAGRVVLGYYNAQTARTWTKKDKTPVTTADIESAKIITKRLCNEFPSHAIVCEEKGFDSGEPQLAQYTWYVDPNDGTTSFINGTGHFAIHLGLVYKHQAILGVVYAPVSGKMYRAGKGIGAILRLKNDKGTSTSEEELRVSDRTLEDAILTTSELGLSREKANELRKNLGAKSLVQSGSFGIKVGLITEKKADLYVSNSKRTGEWDACGPSVIATESGGKLTDFNGRAILFNKGYKTTLSSGIVCSNGKVHQKALQRIREYVAIE